jgi:Ca2+/Na+ antiporter
MGAVSPVSSTIFAAFASGSPEITTTSMPVAVNSASLPSSSVR